MLILERKIEESIMIGDEVIIKVLDIDNGQVKFGIEAPVEIAVHRKEVYKQIQLEADVWTNY